MPPPGMSSKPEPTMATLEVENPPLTDENSLAVGGRVTTEIRFTWKYSQKVDSQGRIQFPGKWKLRTSETDMMAVILLHEWVRKEYILVLPSELSGSFTAGLRNLPFTHTHAQVFRHKYVDDMMLLDLDSAGRFTLPAELRQRVGLDKEALMVGCLDRFEIWNPGDYDLVRKEEREMQLRTPLQFKDPLAI